MKAVLSTLMLIGLCFLFSCEAHTNSNSPQKIAYVGVNVIPMDSERVLPNQVVVVTENKVTEIIPAQGFKADKNTKIIDGTGKYLMPGMSEFHSHIPNAQNGDFTNTQETMWLYLMHGVLTVRGMIGHPSHLELIEKIKNAEMEGPRIFAAGPSLNGNSVANPEAGAEMVRNQAAAGYHHLKLHPGLDIPKFEAIASTAMEVGIRFGGHVSADVGLANSLSGGFKSVEHMDGYIEALVSDKSKLDPQIAGPFGLYLSPHIDKDRMSELVQMTLDGGAWIVPTQSLFERWFGPKSTSEFQDDDEFKLVSVQLRGAWFNQRRMLENSIPDYKLIEEYITFRCEMIKMLHAAGVPFVLGSDSPQVFNVPGFSVYHELEAMQRCGLSPYEVLKSGSINAAAYFDEKDIFGVIKPGADADFVLLDQNPLEDVANFRSLNAISIQGKYYNRDFLNQKRSEIIARHQEE
jgi:hypothetical protein